MTLFILIITGTISALIAHSKGRNPIGWFFVGFLLGLIGIIISLVMPNLKDAQAKEEQMEMEQRRLREQLRQERLKNEQFRKHTHARLDAHDDALQMDTRSEIAELAERQIELLKDGGEVLDHETDVNDLIEIDDRAGSNEVIEGLVGEDFSAPVEPPVETKYPERPDDDYPYKPNKQE